MGIFYNLQPQGWAKGVGGSGWARATITLWWQLCVYPVRARLERAGERSWQLRALVPSLSPSLSPPPGPCGAVPELAAARGTCSQPRIPRILMPRSRGGNAGLGAVREAVWPPGCSMAACSSRVRAALPGRASTKWGCAWLRGSGMGSSGPVSPQGAPAGWGPLSQQCLGMLLPHHRPRAGDSWDWAGAGAGPRRLARRMMLCFMPVSGGWMVGRVLL